MSDKHVCPHCFLELDSHAAKANHVRWKHKRPEGFTEAGRAAMREKVTQRNRERFGEVVTLQLECRKCGTSFEFKTCANSRRKRTPAHCSQTCANSHGRTDESKLKTSLSMLRALEDPVLKEKFMQNLHAHDKGRYSSRAERALCECLRPLGFVRHRVMRTPEDLTFDVDAVSADGRVWVESDGEWHFRQVHPGHDFARTQARDAAEEAEALRRSVLLVRLDNQKYGIEEQVRLVLRTIEEWDGTTGSVVRHW